MTLGNYPVKGLYFTAAGVPQVCMLKVFFWLHYISIILEASAHVVDFSLVVLAIRFFRVIEVS